MRGPALYLIVMALLAPSGVGAQSVAAGVHLESYRFDRPEAPAHISLVSVPFRASVPLGPRVTMGLSGVWASGSMRWDGVDSHVRGLTDTEVAATVALAKDGVVGVTGVLILPTGHSTHTDDESAVAGLIASDVLPFRISNWGTGGGAGVRASATRSLGVWGAGLSVGYFVAQDFSPAEGREVSYRPGNNLVVRAAFDRAMGPAGKGSLQFTYRRYSADRLDETNLYRSGDRYQAVGSYAFAAGRTSSAIVYAGAMHRTAGTFLSDFTPSGAQTALVAGGGARLRVRGTLLLPSVDLRALRRADGRGQGFDGRIGASLEWSSGRATFEPSARVHVGRLSLLPGVDSRFVGAEFGMSVRFQGRPGP